MSEILYNPYYLTPLVSLFGCLIGLGFCYYYYVPKLNFLKKRLREKADELYRTKHYLEKSRYELVITASESSENLDEYSNLQAILNEQRLEIFNLNEKIANLENAKFEKQNIFGIRSQRKLHNQFDDSFSPNKLVSDKDKTETLKKSA